MRWERWLTDAAYVSAYVSSILHIIDGAEEDSVYVEFEDWQRVEWKVGGERHSLLHTVGLIYEISINHCVDFHKYQTYSGFKKAWKNLFVRIFLNP